jgi:hypothetical protein
MSMNPRYGLEKNLEGGIGSHRSWVECGGDEALAKDHSIASRFKKRA